MNQVSLFAGVGAFELAAREYNIKTVLSCELDKYASQVLRKQFPETEVFNEDVRKLRGRDIITRHGGIDILTAGFPCQSFSIAGKREGFRDATRGTLFYEVIRLADEMRPKYIFLENVRGLVSHDGGRTIFTIFQSLSELGYDVEWQILNSRYFGVPQNRERIYIVGHIRGECTRQIFPIKKTGGIINGKDKFLRWQNSKDGVVESDFSSTLMGGGSGVDIRKRPAIKVIGRLNSSQDGQIFDKNGLSQCLSAGHGNTPKIQVDRNNQAIEIMKIGKVNYSQSGAVYSPDGLTPTLCGEGGGMGAKTGLYKTGARIRRLTPIECERLQSFPDNWTNIDGMSDTQRYKQMGNSITVNVLREIYKALIK